MKGKTIRTGVDTSKRQVRVHARRVALGATLFALVAYLMAGTIADLVVVDHLRGSIDARLAVRLDAFVHGLSPHFGTENPGETQLPRATGDLNEAPILAWFVPKGARRALRLNTDAPALPPSELRVGRPTDARFAGRTFRLEGATIRTGRFVVGTSAQEVGGVLSTLIIIEGALAPLVLLILFIAASVIGRRAAAPIERARLRQLEFTADASHELRTPLSVIEAEVGLALSSERSAPAYRVALERVAGESKRLRSIVDDLLWLARLDALPVVPQHEPVEVASIAKGCSERFRAVAAQRAVAISVAEIGSRSPIIVAPADWLDRLVSVLLDNACRYTNDGGRVDVSVSATDDWVTLTVDDSGPGIAEEEHEHIMQRFHRASAIPGGAGLGLAIASAVVQATNGDLIIATAPIGGARIETSWPRIRVDDESAEPGEQGDHLVPSARP